MKRYLLKKMTICLVFLISVSISGCASYLTQGSPLQSVLENGEKSTGEFVKYKYSGSLKENIGHLEKTPMCAVMIEKLRVAKKYPRGYPITFAELLLFGLGFADQAHVQAIVENSKIIEPLAKYESSQFVECGKKQPAAGEEIVIFVRPEIKNGVVPAPYYRTSSTDENGMIDFNKVFSDETRMLNLTARLASDDTQAVSFTFTPRSYFK